MAVIGTFGSYGTARLAMYAAQTSMNVTGNNIGNINTTGYTRQRPDQCSMYSVGTPRYVSSGSINIGYGAMVQNVSQLRDPYLDIRYRNENASLGYHEAMQDGFNQLAHILDEVGRGEDDFGMIEAQLGEHLKGALDDLLAHPDSVQDDDIVRAAASTLCRLINTSAKELQEVKNNEEDKMMEDVRAVNEILTNIRDLNEQIRTHSVYGDNALELRDARNVQIDKLSKYMKINVVYSTEKIDNKTEIEKLTISLDDTTDPNTGKPYVLVDGIYATQFKMPETTPMPNPKYNPENPKGMHYATASGQPTDNIILGRIRNEQYLNPDFQFIYSPADKAPADAPNRPYSKEPVSGTIVNPLYTYRYIADETKYPAGTEGVYSGKDKDGKDTLYTNDPDKAKIRTNTAPYNTNTATAYDANDETGHKYLARDPKSFTPALTPVNPPVTAGQDYNILQVGQGDNAVYYTNKPEYAVPMDNFKDGSNENLYMFSLDALKNKDGRVLNEHTDNESLEVQLGDNDLFGSLQAMRELLTEEGEYASVADLALDPNAATKRGIPYYQHLLDSFAQKFAEVFNGVNQMDAADMEKIYKNNGGTFLKYHSDTDNVMVPDPANPANEIPLTQQMITELDTKLKDTTKYKDNYPNYPNDPQYEKDQQTYYSYMDALRDQGETTDLYDYYDGGVLFSNNGNKDDPTGITAMNISVSHAWSEGSVRVLNTKQPNETHVKEDGTVETISGKTRNENLAHIISLLDQKLEYKTTDTVKDAVDTGKAFFTGTFQEMKGKGPAQLAADAETTNVLYSNFSITTLNLDNDRISVSGVDLNEEATNMMQFSQAFSAACQLLTTIDSMLDKLINNTLR